MTNKTSYLDQPCERCGHKKNLSKIRKASLSKMSGSVQIEYSQIICTNGKCQKEFEGKLKEKMDKEALIRLKRAEHKMAKVI